MDKKLMTISTSMMLLKLLEQQDMYGYQMIQTLNERSNSVFSLKEGTLYPLLHGLEREGCIESYEKIAESGRSRKYYKITKEGLRTLKEKESDWDSYQKAVNQVMGRVAYGKLVYEI